jgi:predicted RNA-binding protein with PUA-like domain
MRILMCGTGGAGEQNFEQTVRNPVDLEQYAGTLTFTQRQLLEARHGRFARVWGIPAHKHITDELKPGDQVWFHHSNFVNDVAQVVTVFRNLGFDEALWDARDFDSSGFIFTVTEPQAARISKARINELLDYSEKNNWVGNRLLSEEKSKLLSSAVHLTI